MRGNHLTLRIRTREVGKFFIDELLIVAGKFFIDELLIVADSGQHRDFNECCIGKESRSIFA